MKTLVNPIFPSALRDLVGRRSLVTESSFYFIKTRPTLAAIYLKERKIESAAPVPLPLNPAREDERKT
jgi:hypothetical protein